MTIELTGYIYLCQENDGHKNMLVDHFLHQVSQNKVCTFISHIVASFASILKIRLGLDSEDFKLDYDTKKFTSCIY